MNLIEGTLEQAIEALAKRAADLRTRSLTVQEKQAGVRDFLGSLGQQVQANPILSHTLLGGAVGAGLSGGATALGNRKKNPGERSSILGSMLTGGLAGGAIGGGASMAHQGFRNIRGPQEMGTDATPPGSFIDEGGQQRRISPEALRNNPRLAARVRELTAPQNPVDRGLSASLAGAGRLLARGAGVGHIPWVQRNITGDTGDSWLDRNVPISSNVLPTVGLADAATHTFNTGEHGFTLPQWLGGRRVQLPGRVRPEFSTDVNHLISGLTSKNLPEAIPEPIRNAIAAHMPHGHPTTNIPQAAGTGNTRSITDILAEMPRNGPSTENVLNLLHTPTSKLVEKLQTPGGERITEGLQHGAPELLRMNRGQLRSAVGEGVRADANLAGRNLTRTLRGGTRAMASMPWQVAGRAGVYGLLPAIEYGLRNQAQQSNNEEALRALVAQHAPPLPQR